MQPSCILMHLASLYILSLSLLTSNDTCHISAPLFYIKCEGYAFDKKQTSFIRCIMYLHWANDQSWNDQQMTETLFTFLTKTNTFLSFCKALCPFFKVFCQHNITAISLSLFPFISWLSLFFFILSFNYFFFFDVY